VLVLTKQSKHFYDLELEIGDVDLEKSQLGGGLKLKGPLLLMKASHHRESGRLDTQATIWACLVGCIHFIQGWVGSYNLRKKSDERMQKYDCIMPH
jgi:hypothetical protein